MTTTLLRPTVELSMPTPRSRVAQRRYALRDLTQTGNRGEPVYPALDVSATHDRDRKRYLLIVSRVAVGPVFVSTAITFGRDGRPDSARGYYVPAERYSQKQMVALLDEFIAETIEPDLQNLLAWATGAIVEVGA